MRSSRKFTVIALLAALFSNAPFARGAELSGVFKDLMVELAERTPLSRDGSQLIENLTDGEVKSNSKDVPHVLSSMDWALAYEKKTSEQLVKDFRAIEMLSGGVVFPNDWIRRASEALAKEPSSDARFAFAIAFNQYVAHGTSEAERVLAKLKEAHQKIGAYLTAAGKTEGPFLSVSLTHTNTLAALADDMAMKATYFQPGARSYDDMGFMDLRGDRGMAKSISLEGDEAVKLTLEGKQ